MAKEFDIYLKQRLTECDIIVYSIPYRDGLTATNRIILESCLESYVLQKFIAVETSSDLVSHIDKMIKICYERLGVPSIIDATAAFQTHYVLNPVPNPVNILSNNDLTIVRNMFNEAENELQFTISEVDAMVAKTLGSGSSSIYVDFSIRNTLKNSLLRPDTNIAFDTALRNTNGRDFIDISSSIIPSADLVDLCYRFYTSSGTILQLAASVLKTEIHFSFGYAASEIGLGVNVSEYSTKCAAIESVVHIFADLTEKLIQYMLPEKIGTRMVATVSPILKRHRLFEDMDSDSVSAYDDMALEDVDYIIL